jgi:hypothetical protein
LPKNFTLEQAKVVLQEQNFPVINRERRWVRFNHVQRYPKLTQKTKMKVIKTFTDVCVATATQRGDRRLPLERATALVNAGVDAIVLMTLGTYARCGEYVESKIESQKMNGDWR